jgi:hypothetical protein
MDCHVVQPKRRLQRTVMAAKRYVVHGKDFCWRAIMGKAVWSGLLLAAVQVVAAQAQSSVSVEGRSTARNRPAGLLNEDYLTSTGQTVPRPGISQGAPPSLLDRRIEDRDNRIDQTICSNCD